MQQRLKEQAALAVEKERKAEELRKKEREGAVFDLSAYQMASLFCGLLS